MYSFPVNLCACFLNDLAGSCHAHKATRVYSAIREMDSEVIERDQLRLCAQCLGPGVDLGMEIGNGAPGTGRIC